MKLIFALVVCFCLYASCNVQYKFWSISKFKIVDTALRDNEPIKLLYSSGGPGSNKDLEYYIHVIAVSQQTYDTVNILTPTDKNINLKDENKVYFYFNQNNSYSQAILKKSTNKIRKVARDPKFDDIADNSYPTVIGTIAVTDELK